MTPQGSLEVADPEEEATLPSRSSSLMVSRHSIYLNSQQIAQEAQELEREKQQELGNAEGKTEDWWEPEREKLIPLFTLYLIK